MIAMWLQSRWKSQALMSDSAATRIAAGNMKQTRVAFATGDTQHIAMDQDFKYSE